MGQPLLLGFSAIPRSIRQLFGHDLHDTPVVV
jgi:hypothetical protein